VNAVEVLLPQQCRHCGGSLPQEVQRGQTEAGPRRHQVTEVPKVQAHITEYQCPNVRCKRWQDHPSAVARGSGGAQEQLPQEAVLNVDETGWLSNGD